jgi:histidinol-phosphate aminotransferase
MNVTTYRRPVARPSVDLFLDANEGSPAREDTVAALRSADPELLRRYPDASALERQIAVRLGIDVERVLVTAGADDGIDRSCRVAFAAGGSLLMPRPGFEMFDRYARLAGAGVTGFDWIRGDLPVDDILSRVEADTGAIAVISPNNPTGLAAKAEDVRRLARAVPDTLLIVDAAYAEFADEDLTSLALEFENVVALRTFSKAWGLAGARVGYAIGPPRWIQHMRAAGPPYPVSGASLMIASEALENGEAAMLDHVTTVRAERDLLEQELRRLGAEPTPSQGNFVLAAFDDADRVWEDLQAMGIAVRRWSGRPELENSLRIGCPGNSRDFARLISTLRTTLQPEAVLLDMDGVIADESQSYRESIIETAASFDVAVDRSDIRKLKASGGWNNDWDLTHRLITQAGVDTTYDEVVSRFEAIYQGDDERPGLRERERLLVDPALLERIAKRFRLGIVTGRPRGDAFDFLERQGIAGLFPVVVTLDDAPAKPDPAPVRLALERLGVRSAWMVGDTPDDAAAARMAGVLPLGILAPDPDDAVPTDDLMASGCARVLSGLDQLEELLP